MVLLNWAVQKGAQSRHQFSNDPLGLLLQFFHAEILLFHLIKFALEMEKFLLLVQFSLLVQCFVLRKEPFGLVVDKVTQHFKRVFLFDVLAFEQFSNFGHSLSYVLDLSLLFFCNLRTF